MTQTPAQAPCPECGHPIAQASLGRCPSCGRAIDRVDTLREGPVAVSGAGILVMVAFTFGTPMLGLIAMAIMVKTESAALVSLIVPYAALLSKGASLTPLAWIAGGLQGPVYGLVLGFATPARKHVGVWVAIAVMHGIVALLAFVVTHR